MNIYVFLATLLYITKTLIWFVLNFIESSTILVTSKLQSRSPWKSFCFGLKMFLMFLLLEVYVSYLKWSLTIHLLFLSLICYNVHTYWLIVWSKHWIYCIKQKNNGGLYDEITCRDNLESVSKQIFLSGIFLYAWRAASITISSVSMLDNDKNGIRYITFK